MGGVGFHDRREVRIRLIAGCIGTHRMSALSSVRLARSPAIALSAFRAEGFLFRKRFFHCFSGENCNFGYFGLLLLKF